MKFQIPTDYIKGFEQLNDISNNEVNSLAKKLSGIRVGTGIKEFSEIFGETTPNAFVEVLYSFGGLLSSTDIAVESIAEELSLQAEKSIKGVSSSEIYKKLVILLNNGGNLKLTFKALKLVLENQSIYKDSKIISDIRLIFDDEINEQQEPQQAELIHRLKVETYEDGSEKDIYISLDGTDLFELKRVIDRAVEKEEFIKNTNKQLSFVEFTD